MDLPQFTLIAFAVTSLLYCVNPCQFDLAPPQPISNQLWAGSGKVSYNVNEQITFQVSSNQSGEITYFIGEDRFAPAIEEGAINASANQSYTLDVSLDHPGFLLLIVRQNGQEYTVGVGVEPCEIEPLSIEPDDFNQFWELLGPDLGHPLRQF